MNVVEIAKQLVNTKFYQGISNEALLNVFNSYFQDATEIAKVQDENGLTHLVVGMNCHLQDLDHAILLSGHMDTVKPGENWDTEAKVEGDLLYGLGSSDMKSFFAAVIHNFEEIKNLETPVVLSITSDEETLGEGIKAVTSFMEEKNIHPQYALVGEPTKNQVITSNRGNYVHVLSLTGKECHSMNPSNGINALYAASHIIGHIEKLEEVYKGRATLNPILVEGGKMPNQVCGKCLMKLSIRTSSSKIHTEIEDAIATKVEEIAKQYQLPAFSFEKVFELSAFEQKPSDINNFLCDYLNTSEGEYLATTEAGELQKYGIENITILGPGNLDLAHKQGEYCACSQLKFYDENLPKMLQEISKKMDIQNEKGGMSK